MKVSQLWTDKVIKCNKVQDINGQNQAIYDVIFTGDKVIATAGPEILVYNAIDGTLFKALKAHKESVISLCPLMGDGFASGGADKQVIIWSSTFQGTLKYSHGDSIQSISQSPISGVVLTCTASDFGLWTPGIKAVPKTKVPSRIVASAWTPDGQQFALGLYNGHISIRSSSGEEQVRIERGTSPIWTLSWSTASDLECNVLAVADWSQRVSFFESTGRQVGKDKQIDFDPCSISHFGDYVLLGGSNKQVQLWTSEGVKIDEVCKKDGWIWACKTKKDSPCVAVGSEDGTISVYQITFDTVSTIYADKFAYRQSMTDVLIRNLTTNQESKIKCKDCIKNIAIYKDSLVVQLPERIFLYELFYDENSDMHYRIREKIHKKLDCVHLLVTAENILSTSKNRLEMISFSGDVQHDWNFRADISFAKVIGGPRGREGLLVALKDGSVYKLFINNPFPVLLVQHSCLVKSVDINVTRKRLAVVDNENICTVYDLFSKQILFQEPNTTSASWNLEVENLLTFSGNGTFSVKFGDITSFQRNIDGQVIGFKGNTVYCLDGNLVDLVDVPQSVPLDHYLEKGDFESAYKVACLGVAESDWNRIGKLALEQLNLEVAKKSFCRIRNFKYLETLRTLAKLKQEGRKETDLFLAEISSYCGNFYDAAKLFQKSGNTQKAIDMYTELNLWEAAQQLVESSNQSPAELLKKKALIQAERKDVLAAAATYEEVGDYSKAVELLGEEGYIEEVMNILRNKLTAKDSAVISSCVEYFKKHQQIEYAIEAMKKLGDMKSLLSIYVDLQNWDEAFKIAEFHPELHEQIYLPYGNWLAMNDRFEEAQEYYARAGRPDESIRILKFLVENAVYQHRFKMAGNYYWALAKETLAIISKKSNVSQKEDQSIAIENWKQYRRLGEVYYAYSQIYKFVEDPFTLAPPESLMNASKFVLVYILNNPCPPEISKIYTLYCLAKISFKLGCYKTSKFAFDKLLQMKLSQEWQDTNQQFALLVRGKPAADPEEFKTVCYQCSFVQPFMNTRDTCCSNCLEPNVYSFYSFGNLPMIRFTPDPSLTEEQVYKLIQTDPPVNADESKDDFLNMTESERSKSSYSPIVFSKEKITSCNPYSVFIRKWPSKEVPAEYYLVVSEDVHVVMCSSCQQFYEEGEWNYEVLLLGCCPFCKQGYKNS